MYKEAGKYVSTVRGENQSVETHTQKQMTELAGKDFEMVTTIIGGYTQEAKEYWSMLSKVRENIKDPHQTPRNG